MADHKKAGFTCNDVFLIPDFKEAVVLAGANGMQRIINRVNVMEVPDVIDWVRPGEFLITSGFPFRDQPDAIADIIPQLVEKGVSALGIKTKRFIDQIPARALELADQLDFPIFELPAAIVFSDVVRDIMERVLVQEARELSLLQSRFQKLSQQLLHGKGLEEFLQTLDSILNNPIILLDDSNQLFLSPQAEILEEADNPMLWAALREESNLGVSFITLGERRIRVYVSAVNDKQYDKCLLVLLEWNQEHSVVDRLTIDRVGVLVGLEMINANARREVELKYVDQFLQDWITGRIVTIEDLRLRAEACGHSLEDDRPRCVALVRFLNSKPNIKTMQQAIKRLRTKSICEDLQATILEGEMIFLFPEAMNGIRNVAVEAILADMKTLFPTESFSLCVGNRTLVAEKVHESYNDAKKIHHISSICDYRETYVDYMKLGVFQLLYHLPDTEEVQDYRDRFILPLLAYDAKHNSQLFETLKVYFKHNRNVKKTSAELFTHYNTVSYRVERVCELLGINMDNGDDILQLHLAVKLNEMRPA
ncbi:MULTISPECIES: PucR family transcriptional regulator [Paenibacillus]|uniref:PucR family transcriptional regulator n=1 Tax=Paenibacillus xylanilyticus TaxID=248903 RepID=A0A7Y6EWG1_9BACL|nr:PucR family transcriptional regulator [Paenibacillus xylanilyticus]NUU79282.1 PucR family transcriptional regulator [Paenibacillus xylanilyticus]